MPDIFNDAIKLPGIDPADFPGSLGAPPTMIPLDVQVAALISGGTMTQGDTLVKTSDVQGIADARADLRIAANRSATETLTGTKNFSGATLSVATEATVVGTATGATLDRPASIGYLKKALFDAFGPLGIIIDKPGEFQSGLRPVILGYQAGQYNTGAYPIILGDQTGQFNVGTYPILIGDQTGQYNSGTYPTMMGYQTGLYNDGDHVVALGHLSARNNGGHYLTALGYGAARHNSGINNVVIGYNAWTVTSDTANEAAFTQTALNVGTQTVTLTSTTGIGTVGKRYSMKYTTVSGTPPTGLVNNSDYSLLVLSSTQIQFPAGTFSAIGSGSFKLTPYNGREFTNTTCLGSSSVPTASNQVVLGGPTVTSLRTTATSIVTGTIPAYANDAAADADATLLSKSFYKIGRALYQKP
jgi:hypothetical protein